MKRIGEEIIENLKNIKDFVIGLIALIMLIGFVKLVSIPFKADKIEKPKATIESIEIPQLDSIQAQEFKAEIISDLENF